MRQIGPYFLSRRIGSGGMAEVWMAHRSSMGAHKTVAIKLLAPNLASRPEYRKMFLEEARLSMLLNNSRLVQVFDVGESAGECYIAMEWIDGVNLAELQGGLWGRGCRLPVDVAMFITGEVLRALHYTHNLVYEGSSSIVHRDVSPQNVMLSVAGEVKLADFGVARFSTEETTGLHVKGKLRYMPPEQLQGKSRDATVDVFAVGAILHEMLEGRKFRGASTDDGQLLSMILAREIPELTDLGGVPLELDGLRRGMLMPEVHRRVATALAAVQQLEGCPGYRNTSLDLEKLIREHRRLTGENSNHPIVLPMPESQTKDTSVSRRLSRAENPPTGTERRKSHGNGPRREPRMAAALVLGLAGLGVGGSGIGIAMQEVFPESRVAVAERDVARIEWSWLEVRLSERQPPTPEIAIAEEPATKLEPAPDPSPVPTPEPAAIPEVPEEEPVLEPAPPPPPKPKVSPKPEPVGPPVKVVVAAGDFTSLYLKLGSKVYLLDPFVNVELPPGKHKLRIREDPKGKWQSVTVVIPKKPCRVVFKRPNLADVKLL